MDCLHLANDIIVARNLLIPRLTALKDIDYAFFVVIFEDLFGEDFADFSATVPKSRSHEIQLMARLLAFVSKDLFAIDLDHIRADAIVAHNVLPIHDFLEIIATFVKHLPKEFKENNVFPSTPKTMPAKRSPKMSTEDILRSLDPYKSESSSSPKSLSSSESNEPLRRPKESTTRRRSLRHAKSSFGYDTSNRKEDSSKQSIAIQTDIEIPIGVQTTSTAVSPKAIKHIGLQTSGLDSPKPVTGFDEYKRLKCENFATLLGHRLHETLRLKELTDSIEYRVKQYYGDVTTQTPQRIVRKSAAKAKSGRKVSFRTKRSPQVKRKTPAKCQNSLRQSFRTQNLDDLVKSFPEIPRNTVQSLRNQERHQKKVMENLNKDIKVNEQKVKSRLNAAIDTQQKRSQLIRDEMKHLETLAETKSSKMLKIKENAEKRDERIERSRMHKMMDRFQNDMNAKYKRLQAMEERIVLKEYEEKEKRRKDHINDFRQRIKEKHSLEMNKQKKLLDAIESLYQNKYEELNQSLTEEEKRLKNEISSQSHYLRSIKREFNERFQNDFTNIFS
ncbi:unnamed protein product [Medioppia subpectinata]|uniref:DUF5745 domain-containing protein n=1 Tax=Medioppia subpectinata TaxID=1979941 RepID=A0A7R9PXI8_9ACAR|nr:unnamed protein product [Medioppia subpectinata]CAG2105051.1 unnamed protein product [Medioppia subpectinata]